MRRGRFILGAGLTVGLAMALAGALALAAAPAAVPALADQRARLDQARAASLAAARRSAALERAAAQARNAADAARAREAAVAARVQGAEADIAAAQARIAIVDRLLSAQQVELARRQGAIVKLIAALQSMARRPAVLSVVQPGSTDDLVHVRAVLGTVTPVIAARTADVRAAIARTRALRLESARAVAALRSGRERYQAEQLALARIEGENRLRSRDLGRSALIESDRAIALGEQARDIVDLMDQMSSAAAVRGDLEKLPGPLPRPAQPGAAPEPVAPPLGRGSSQPYRLPLWGDVVRGFGEVSDAGVRSRGITLAARPGAQAVAPAAGRVLYAGKFRGYGQIIIIDHGGGWTSLVTGLARVTAPVGAVLAQGSPIGQAPPGEGGQVTIELRRKGVPVDFVPLLG